MITLGMVMDELLLMAANPQIIFFLAFVLGCIWFNKSESRMGVFADNTHKTFTMVTRGFFTGIITMQLLGMFPLEALPFITLLLISTIIRYL